MPSPEASRENGKLGGRPKATHTVEAEKLKAYLIERVVAEQAPIIDALIGKAKAGDVQALKEILERTIGKVKDVQEIQHTIETLIMDV